MSRAVLLNMTEKAVVSHCKAEGIGISAVSQLPTGETRIVCMSVRGAARLREELANKLAKNDSASLKGGPGRDFVERT